LDVRAGAVILKALISHDDPKGSEEEEEEKNAVPPLLPAWSLPDGTFDASLVPPDFRSGFVSIIG
jgi:hypothetical protein